MALVSSIRVNAQLNYLKAPVRRIAHQSTPQGTARQFSSVFQGARHTSRCGVFKPMLSSRSHLSMSSFLPWSGNSSSPTVLAAERSKLQDEPTPTPASEPTVAAEPMPPATSEPLVPPESVVQAEPLAQADSIVETSSATDVIDSLSDSLASLPGPLHFGDLADLGLGSIGPTGIVLRMIEAVNVITGLPWFYTIILGTIVVRLSTFYFTIQQTRMTARVRNAPQIEEAKKKLEIAKETGDSFKIGVAGGEMQKAYRDAGVSMAKMVAFPLVQLPPAIGLFLGVKGMCALPVEQLKHSGMSLIRDLTLVSGTAAFDPYYVLPLIGCAALNAQLKLSMQDLGPEQTMAPHVINAVRCLSPLILYFSSYFPAGLLISISTGIGFSVAQAAFFRNKAIRQKLDIPFVPKTSAEPPTVLQSLRYGATQAQERGWATSFMSLFRIGGGEEVANAHATKSAKAKTGDAFPQVPKVDFMEGQSVKAASAVPRRKHKYAS